MLKHNKYVCILSIAVTTLLYITISMITIFSMYIAHVRLGSGRNSYQGHVNDSGEFWRVLGCTRIRRHWKRNIVDTFTHHFCANGHGWTIGTGFSYIRTSKRQYSTPVQYTCISSCLSWLYFALQALSLLKPYTRWENTCIAALYAAQHALVSEGLATPGQPCRQASRTDPWHKSLYNEAQLQWYFLSDDPKALWFASLSLKLWALNKSVMYAQFLARIRTNS